MATKDPNQDRLDLIHQELVELREAFDAFSNGGFPLQQQMPTPQMLATFAAFIAMMQHQGTPSPQELQFKLQASMTLGADILQFLDAYQRHTEKSSLERLAS